MTSSGVESFVSAVYRWLDDNCIVIVSGMESIDCLSESDQEQLGSREYTHKILLSNKSIQDPSLSFVSVISDGWSMGVKLLAAKGEVYQWLATDSPDDTSPRTYYVKHVSELNNFVAEVVRHSNNVIVWG